MEDVNTRKRRKKIHQYVRNWTIWNKSDEFWNSVVNSLFYGAFSSLSSSSSLNSLRSTVDYRPTLPRFIRTLLGSQKLQSLHQALHFTAHIVACAGTGLRGTWCWLLFARPLQVLQPLRLNTPPLSFPARSIGELACSLRKIPRQYLRQKLVTPLFW